MRGVTILLMMCLGLLTGCGKQTEWRILDTPSGLRRVNDATGEVQKMNTKGEWVPVKPGSSTPL